MYNDVQCTHYYKITKIITTTKPQNNYYIHQCQSLSTVAECTFSKSTCISTDVSVRTISVGVQVEADSQSFIVPLVSRWSPIASGNLDQPWLSLRDLWQHSRPSTCQWLPQPLWQLRSRWKSGPLVLEFWSAVVRHQATVALQKK